MTMEKKYPQIFNSIIAKSILLGLLLSIFTFGEVTAQIQAQKSNNPSNALKVDINKLVQSNKAQDVSYVITAQHTSRTSGIHHMYLRQAVNGIEIIGTESSIHRTSDGNILKIHNNFVKDIESTVRTASPGISASEAINGVAQQMGYTISGLRNWNVRAQSIKRHFIIKRVSLSPIFL